MSHALEIKDNIAIVNLGPITSIKGVQESYDFYVTHELFDDNRPLILDFSNAHISKVSIDELIEHINFLNNHETQIKAPIAFVVNKTLHFGLARMWLSVSDRHITRKRDLFYTMHEAMKWCAESS